MPDSILLPVVAGGLALWLATIILELGFRVWLHFNKRDNT